MNYCDVSSRSEEGKKRKEVAEGGRIDLFGSPSIFKCDDLRVIFVGMRFDTFNL